MAGQKCPSSCRNRRLGRALKPLYYIPYCIILLAIKSFEIQWEGKTATVEYEDDIPYGQMSAILKKSVNMKNFTSPEVDIAEYQLQILQKVITKAPFDPKSILQINNIPSSVADKIISEVMKDYPLGKRSDSWMMSLFGPLDTKNLNLDSMLSVPPPSDGQKEKQTNTPSNSSQTSSSQ